MITALIRTSNRPELFQRALESLHWQTYKDWNVIVGVDSLQAVKYTNLHGFNDQVGLDYYTSEPFFYDKYCQQLAPHVPDDHWFFFLDDDDYLTNPNALAEIAPYLTDPSKPVICQFLRNGVPKPRNGKRIDAGKVGLPCLFLHATHKHLVKCDGYKAGDYRMIKSVCDTLGGYKFAPVVVVETDRRSFGK